MFYVLLLLIFNNIFTSIEFQVTYKLILFVQVREKMEHEQKSID